MIIYNWNTASGTIYREDRHSVDVDLDLLGVLELEGDVLNSPVVTATLDVGFDDKNVRYYLLAGAQPHLAASQQQLFQFVLFEVSTARVRVVCRHRHDIVAARCTGLHCYADVTALWHCTTCAVCFISFIY